MPLTTTRTANDRYWLDWEGRVMGSTARILVGDGPDDLLDWAVAELEYLEQCWSRFRATSELSRLNAQAGTWVDVSAPMLLALTCAADLHWTTRGRFDPTILETLEACGYDRSFEDVAAESDAPPRFHRPAGFRRVEIDEEQSRVRLPAGARIDLGGIGKGLAADLVARGLTERGARHVLLSLGGDVRAHGEPPAPAGWSIPVEDPCRPPRVAFEYSLRNGAIVTSTSRIRAWKRRGQACHHIIDPQSGMPAATGVVAVVAAGLDAWWAEGVAKAILVAGLESGVALAHAHAVRAWIYRPDGSFVDTGDA